MAAVAENDILRALLKSRDISGGGVQDASPASRLDSLIEEEGLEHLRDRLEALEPSAAVRAIQGGPPGRIMDRIDSAMLTRLERQQDDRRGPPISGETGAPRPRREDLGPDLSPIEDALRESSAVRDATRVYQ